MPETIYQISERLKLSVSDEREHPFKLIFGGHSSFVYFDKEEWEAIKEKVEN